MAPDDVYVVYDQQDDVILSVHSFKEFAIMERDKLVKAQFASRGSSLSRYCITDLSEAIAWITQSVPEDTLDITSFNKIDI